MKLDAAGDYLWHQVFYRTPPNFSWSYWFSEARADLDGNLVITGHFDNQVDFGTGAPTHPNNGFVGKFSGATGANLWVKQFAGNFHGGVSGVDFDASKDIVISGSNAFWQSGDSFSLGFVARFDTAGNLLWGQFLGDSTGSAYVTGSASSGAVDIGAGAAPPGGLSGSFLVKFDAAGATLSIHFFGNGFPTNALLVDGTGSAILGGRLNGTLDLGCGRT